MSAARRIVSGLVATAEQEGFAGYWLDDTLAEAVNVSLLLKRPLLLTGEPGTGKTTLATAVARALGWRFLRFDCKSTSVGRDLLYQFDYLQRLYDAQHPDARKREVQDYVRLAALGEAIKSGEDAVVLVDEVDKAPRDFPNDLLTEVETCRFSVPEVGDGKYFRSERTPLIIITSNRERQLPAPFLRRCTFHHIAYPSNDTLQRILKVHTHDLQLSEDLVRAAVERFDAIRAIGGLFKRPATDELVAWAKVLHHLGVSPARVASDPLKELPGLSAVFKTIEDLELAQG